MLCGEQFVCQLFFELLVGLDFVGFGIRVVCEGDEWVVNGQKVWSFGVQFADWGEFIARIDFDVFKYDGLIVFLLLMNMLGVIV